MLYDLKCLDCGEISRNVFVRTYDEPRICEHCGSENTETLPNYTPAAHFKGSGFYETDYKRKP